MQNISRRRFLRTAGVAAVGAALSPSDILLSADRKKKGLPAGPVCNYRFADGVGTLRIWSSDVREPVRLFVIADTHLWESDAREEPYSRFSARMHAAYNQVSHYRTLQPTTPAACFRETLETARKIQPDAIVHLGDLVSYPSEYSIEYASGLIRETGIPFYYVSGNHDWCYEGFESDAFKHRETWMSRLKPFYPEGVNPLMYSIDVKGVKLIFIDDSVDDVTPEQIDFFRNEVRQGIPSLLMMHIGQYLPGHDTFYLGYIPGYRAGFHPGRGVEMLDKQAGHVRTIERFYREVRRASREDKLLATVAGHNHDVRTEEAEGIRQFGVPFNGNGSYTDLYILPAEE